MGAREAIAAIEWEEARKRATEDPELLAFVGEVSAGLATGTDLTAAELRVDHLLEWIGREHARLDHLCDFTERKVEMLREYQATEAGKIEKRIAWLEGQVRGNLPMDAAHFSKAYGKRSLSLPHGNVGYRATPPTVVIEDDAKAVAWAKSKGIRVKTEERVGKRDVLDWIQETGELPDADCIEFIDSHDTFYTKPKGD